jgi:hypothetical protein
MDLPKPAISWYNERMEKADKINITGADNESIPVMSEPSKLIPKLATKVGVSKGGSNYIISFLAALPNEQATMIERIVLDENNIDKLIELLQTLKEEATNE